MSMLSKGDAVLSPQNTVLLRAVGFSVEKIFFNSGLNQTHSNVECGCQPNAAYKSKDCSIDEQSVLTA